MRKWLMMTVVLAGLAGPLFGAVIFSDDFESETVGEDPSNWTNSSVWATFYVSDSGVPGKCMHSAQYQGTYTMDSKEIFTEAEMSSWTLEFDHKNYQQWSEWNYADILRTPGNFLLSKDQYHGIDVYNGDGSLLGTTTHEGAWMNTVETWTHYTVSYSGGVLTVTASNANKTTSGTFSGAVPDFSANDRIIFGALPSASGTQYTDIDNVMLDAVPERATMGLLAVGGVLTLLRKRR
jgi:hypothetical protein